MTSSSLPEATYFQITHTNSLLKFISEETFLYMSRLCGTLETLKEISFGNDINTLFNRIIPENTSNLLHFNQNLSLKNKALFSISTLETSMNILLNQPYLNELSLTEQFSSYISSILSYCFNKIKHFKIKTYEQFISSLHESIHYEQDIIQQYHKQHECFLKDNKRHFNSDVLLFHITEKEGNNGGMVFQRKDERKRTYDDISLKKKERNGLRMSNRSLTLLGSKMLLNNEQKIYHFEFVKKAYNKGKVPDELIVLVNKFQCIRKIKLTLAMFEKGNSNYKQYLYNVIYILINHEWLLPNLLEIEFDLSNENLYSELKRDYLLLFKKKKFIIKNTKYDTGFSTQREFIKSIEDNSYNDIDNIDDNIDISELRDSAFFSGNESNQIIEDIDNVNNNTQIKQHKKHSHFLLNIINDYIYMYDALIIYLYFISKIENVHVIKMTIPDTFSKDIHMYLTKNQIFSPSFYHFNFLFLKSNLYDLTLDFNCLDSQFFDLLSGFIYKNKFIKNIRLSFFPIDEYFSPEMLYRLLTVPHKEKLNSLLSIKQDNDIDELILEILIPSLEENFNQFFFSLEKKTDLNEIVLLFDLPTLIYNNEKYIMILIKFIMNILLLIKYSKCKSKSLNIYAEYLPFNTRKYPFIESFLDELELCYMQSSCSLMKMSFHVQFNSVVNIENMIPNSLIYLSIGELDMETFEEFVMYFISKEYKSVSKLETIKISLSKSVLQLNETMKLISDMLISYPKTVKVFSISSWLPLIHKTMIEICKRINYNSLEYVKFEFLKNDSIVHRSSFSSNYSGTGSSNCNNSYLNECFYIQRNYIQTQHLLELLMRLGTYYNNKNLLNYNILCNIERFLYPKYPKELIIKTK